MAFPVIESDPINNSTGGSATGGDVASTSHSVVLPATVSAGALLMVFGRVCGAGTVAVTGGGWTIAQDSSDGSDDVTFWMYRDTLADGTEDGTSITVTHGNFKMVCAAISITGTANPSAQPPQASTIAVGTGTSVDSGTVTPTGGAKDYTMILFGSGDGEAFTIPPAPPTGYTGPGGAWSTGTGGAVATNARMWITSRDINVSSENPPAQTLNAAVNAGWSAWTIAVHPTTPDIPNVYTARERT